MTVTWNQFDQAYDAMFLQVWQACFLLTGSVKAADDHCFRAFLVLGAAKNADYEGCDHAEQQILLHAVGELARQYYGKKPRRRLTARFLEKYPLSVPVSEEVLRFLHLPLNQRIVSLAAAWGLTGEAQQKAAGLRFLKPKVMSVPDLTGIEPDPERKDDMKGKIYIRFSERSVAVENKIHQAGRRFERIAPFLALVVLALFAFAYFYTESLR